MILVSIETGRPGWGVGLLLAQVSPLIKGEATVSILRRPGFLYVLEAMTPP